MTSAQYHALQVKAARNAQRYRRALETKVNRLETVLNRYVKSKTPITAERYAALASAWDQARAAFAAAEKSMADAIVIF